MKHIAELNKIYNDYIVISDENIVINNITYFKVQCSCGKIENKIAKTLINERTKRCKSCSAKLTFLNNKPKSFEDSWKGKGFGQISKTWFNSIKQGAIKRNINFNLTIEEIWNLAIGQNFKCNLTGLDITFSKSIKKSNVNWDLITASLDRIDSSKDYSIENVQWVHKVYNRFKNNYSQEDFINMCKLVTKYQLEKDNLEPSTDLKDL